MPNDILQQLSKLAKLINTDKIITPEEIEQVFSGIVGILANFKKANEELNTETKERVENLLNYVADEHSKIVSKMEEHTSEYSKHSEKMTVEMEEKMSKMLSECKMLMEECKLAMPQDGKDADEQKIIEEVLAKIKLPEYKETVLDTGEQIVDKINNLPTDDEDKKIHVSHIKGLDEMLKKQPKQIIGGGIVGRDVFKDIDLSAQLDGVTKTFNIMAVWNIISVSLSSYPYGALRKGVDFTWTPTTITFTDEIAADTQLAAGQKCILTVVTA